MRTLQSLLALILFSWPALAYGQTLNIPETVGDRSSQMNINGTSYTVTLNEAPDPYIDLAYLDYQGILLPAMRCNNLVGWTFDFAQNGQYNFVGNWDVDLITVFIGNAPAMTYDGHTFPFGQAPPNWGGAGLELKYAPGLNDQFTAHFGQIFQTNNWAFLQAVGQSPFSYNITTGNCNDGTPSSTYLFNWIVFDVPAQGAVYYPNQWNDAGSVWMMDRPKLQSVEQQQWTNFSFLATTFNGQCR